MGAAPNVFSPDERRLVAALAEAVTPPSARVGPPNEARVARAEALVAEMGEVGAAGWKALLHTLDGVARLTQGGGIEALEPERRQRFVERLHGIEALRWPLFALSTPLKYAASHDADLFSHLGVPFGVRPSLERAPRWEQRVVELASEPHDQTLEVDVVIVGSGAGGAPMARALAQEGLAVLVLEEGRHFTRRDFDGLAYPTVRRMYRGGGAMMAWGNAPMQVLAGVTVGGSTTVNSGTCFRTPDHVLHEWGREFGLTALAPDRLAPYFESIERQLEVGPNPMHVLGGCARVIARGAEALGWEHAPLPRNAPGCDGQGLCCFGCPTDAKRSTNVSIIPKALEAGAMLYAGAHVERILRTGGRASGVVASATRPDGRRVELRVRARAVVVSGGAIPTPLLLLRSGLGNGSGEVGKNLSLHPASYANAIFAERIDGNRGVPQGYGVHQFSGDGILMEGLFVPPDIAASVFEPVGARWSELVDRFEHVASFGFMIRDTARGRVRLGRDGRPFIRYDVNDHDRRRLLYAHARLAEMFLAAGAEVVFPGVAGQPALRSREDLTRFEERAARYRAGDIVLSSFHPLGTARMGMDPSRSVVGPTHESHDVPGLFVVDGSVFPGAPGVNPQITIMALSERASTFVVRAVESSAGRAGKQKLRVAPEVEHADLMPSPPPARAAWSFSEIMAGPVREVDDAVTRDVVLALDVAFIDLAPQLGSAFAGALRLHAELTGTASIGGRAKNVPCKGSLQWSPLGGTEALVYELELVTDDGTPLLLRGCKHVLLPRVLYGATHLHTDLRTEDGALWARGMLTFDLRTMPSFLKSMELVRRFRGRGPERADARASGTDRAEAPTARAGRARA